MFLTCTDMLDPGWPGLSWLCSCCCCCCCCCCCMPPTPIEPGTALAALTDGWLGRLGRRGRLDGPPSCCCPGIRRPGPGPGRGPLLGNWPPSNEKCEKLWEWRARTFTERSSWRAYLGTQISAFYVMPNLSVLKAWQIEIKCLDQNFYK